MLGLVLQVSNDLSATGFVIIVGEDKSPPHPACVGAYWNVITQEYNPQTPEWRGEEKRLTKEKLESLMLRNGVEDPQPLAVHNSETLTE